MSAAAAADQLLAVLKAQMDQTAYFQLLRLLVVAVGDQTAQPLGLLAVRVAVAVVLLYQMVVPGAVLRPVVKATQEAQP
jgi:hypothetical protein